MYGEDETQQTAPIAEGEEYEVKIEDLGKEGDGITRVQGFVVFVPDTKIGDEIKIRITSVRRRFAFAEKI